MRIAVFTFSLLAGACATTPAPSALSVTDVIDRQRQLAGKRIVIVGRLSQCQPLSCGLSDRDGEGREQYISIGRHPVFDKAAPRFQGRRVEIEATVTLDCMPPPDPDLIVMCTDRPDTLADPVLIRPL